MDSTLLGALIGAGAAIAGGIVTAICTYFVNKNIENKKLLTAKKEELYGACIEFNKSMQIYLNMTLTKK